MPVGAKRRVKRNTTAMSQQAVLADYKAAYDLLDRGALAEYAGQFVAVLNGSIVGVGGDSARLRQTVSQQREVDSERLAIIYVLDKTVILG